MTTILLMLKNRPSWEGVVIKTDHTLEKVKEALNEYRKYEKEFTMEGCFAFLLHSGVDDVTLSFIDKAVSM